MASINKGRIADFTVYMKQGYICEAVYSMEEFLKARSDFAHRRAEDRGEGVGAETQEVAGRS